MDKFVDDILAPLLAFITIVVIGLICIGLLLLMTGWIWVGVRSVWSMIF